MDNSIYEPPKSELGTCDTFEIPEKIAKKIKGGWIAATISGVLTCVIMLLVVSDKMSMGNLVDIWTTVDVVLIFVLAFGIYKKSRIAATFMFVYFLISKILLMVETGRSSGLFLSVIFFYYYFQGMVGTFQYHKLVKAHANEVSPQI